MNKQQAEAILRGCSARVDFDAGKAFDHVVLEGWFNVDEIQAVLALLRAAATTDGGTGSKSDLSGEMLPKF
jgi:hypothetical protein